MEVIVTSSDRYIRRSADAKTVKKDENLTPFFQVYCRCVLHTGTLLVAKKDLNFLHAGIKGH